MLSGFCRLGITTKPESLTRITHERATPESTIRNHPDVVSFYFGCAKTSNAYPSSHPSASYHCYQQVPRYQLNIGDSSEAECQVHGDFPAVCDGDTLVTLVDTSARTLQVYTKCGAYPPVKFPSHWSSTDIFLFAALDRPGDCISCEEVLYFEVPATSLPMPVKQQDRFNERWAIAAAFIALISLAVRRKGSTGNAQPRRKRRPKRNKGRRRSATTHSSGSTLVK